MRIETTLVLLLTASCAEDGALTPAGFTDEDPKERERPKAASAVLDGGTNAPSQPPSTTPVADAGRGESSDAGSDSKSDAGVKSDGDASTATDRPIVLRPLDVRYPVSASEIVAQCTDDAKAQLVWKTSTKGTDAYSRWADPQKTLAPGALASCGVAKERRHPIVFVSVAKTGIPIGTWVAKCVARGVAEVFRVSSEVDGQPAASFEYPSEWPSCE